MSEENKKLVRDFFEALDRDAVDAVERFMAEDYIDHNPPFPGLPRGREGVLSYCEHFRHAHPDGRHVILDQVAEGDKVVTRLAGYGTHTGNLMGVEGTGASLEMSGIAIHRIEEGRLAEHWAVTDLVSLMQQIGLIQLPH